MIHNVGNNNTFSNINSTENASGPNANSGASASGATNGQPTSASGLAGIKTSWRKSLVIGMMVGALIGFIALTATGAGTLAIGAAIIAGVLGLSTLCITNGKGSSNDGQQSAPQNLPQSPGNQEPRQNSGGTSGAAGSQRTGGSTWAGGTTVAENISPSGNAAAADYTEMEKKLNAACQAYTESLNGLENLQNELQPVNAEIEKLTKEINDSFTQEQVGEFLNGNVAAADLSKYSALKGSENPKEGEKKIADLFGELKTAVEKKTNLDKKISEFKTDKASKEKHKKEFGKLIDSLCKMSAADRSKALQHYTKNDFEKLHTLIKEGNYDNKSTYLEKLDPDIIMNSNAEIDDTKQAQQLRNAATNVLMKHCPKLSGHKFTSLFTSNNARFNDLTTTSKTKLSKGELKEAERLADAISRELAENKEELINDVKKELGDAGKGITDHEIENSLNFLHRKLQNAIKRTLTSGDETNPTSAKPQFEEETSFEKDTLQNGPTPRTSPTSTTAKPTESKPTESKPTESKPTESKPTTTTPKKALQEDKPDDILENLVKEKLKRNKNLILDKKILNKVEGLDLENIGGVASRCEIPKVNLEGTGIEVDKDYIILFFQGNDYDVKLKLDPRQNAREILGFEAGETKHEINDDGDIYIFTIDKDGFIACQMQDEEPPSLPKTPPPIEEDDFFEESENNA